jgi:hypothetical protein
VCVCVSSCIYSYNIYRLITHPRLGGLFKGSGLHDDAIQIVCPFPPDVGRVLAPSLGLHCLLLGS